MTIFFYRVCEPYGCFSNFSPHSIQLGGEIWSTSEHYYQAQKFVGTPDQHLCQQIRNAPSPEIAAAIGRNPIHTLRPEWDALKPAIMYDAVLTKFMTHPDLAELLLSTGEEWIIEDSPTDDYWGCGADGKGQNQLGRILMRIRTELRDPSYSLQA
jgi:N-glycosidase YbiA